MAIKGESTSTGPGTAAVPTTAARAILCAKCEHLNPAGRHHCQYCKASLLIACKFCRERNPRVNERCAHCGHRLHRSYWRKWRRRLFAGQTRVTWQQAVLLVVAVYVVYRVIVKLAEYSAPPPI